MGNKQEAAHLMEEWKSVKVKLEEKFHNRDQQGTKELMEQGTNLFIQFLCLTNESPVVAGAPFEQFKYKPVNMEERLGFIQSRPTLFHSYRQLGELMIEQEKQFVKKNIKKKSSGPKA